MSALYTLGACEELINKYVDLGGEVVELEEGCLGLGLVVCYGEGLKTTVIREVYLNEWSSAHKVRMYNNMPKKYAKMIEDKEYAA